MKAFPTKRFYWQRWIYVNDSFVFPNPFQVVYLVQPVTTKRKSVTSVTHVKYEYMCAVSQDTPRFQNKQHRACWATSLRNVSPERLDWLGKDDDTLLYVSHQL